MDINIAISTLIYIMVLFFPGLLFRKFYYRGEFVKQLTQLNPIDKLIWNLFFSITMILLTFSLIFLSKKIFNVSIIQRLTYNDLYNLMTTLGDNKFPKETLFNSTYKDVLKIISVLYFQSAVMGYFAHWFVVICGLDTRYSLLRFKNHWYYYIHGGKILYQRPKLKGKIDFTAADILCITGDSTRLYSGIISQYTICPEKNVLDNIFLSNPYRYKYNSETKETDKIHIPSSIFCIPYNTVLNMNFIYVFKERNIRIRNIVVNFITLLFIILLVTSIWLDLSYLGITTWWEKALYFFLSFSFISNLRLFIVEIISGNKQKAIIAFLNITYVCIWYLPLLGVLNLFIAILIFIFVAFIHAMILRTNQNKENIE